MRERRKGQKGPLHLLDKLAPTFPFHACFFQHAEFTRVKGAGYRAESRAMPSRKARSDEVALLMYRITLNVERSTFNYP